MGEKEQLLAAGDAFVESGEIDEAIASFEAAVLSDPQDPDLRMRLASLLFDQERSDDAARCWSSAAQIYQQQGLVSEALATQKKVIEVHPKSTADLEKTAELHAQLDQDQEAVKMLRAAASIHRAEGNTPKRLEAIAKVLALDRSNLRGCVRLAETLVESGDRKGAAGELKRAVVTLEKAEQWEAFEQIAKRCITLDNSDPDVCSRLARRLLSEGRSTEALYALHKVYPSNREDAEVLSLIAEACNEIGQPQKAVIVLKKKASLFEERGLKEQAQEVYKQIKILDPGAVGAGDGGDGGVQSDISEDLREFEAGELQIADISDEEIDALLLEIERAETEDEFSVGAFLDELHGSGEGIIDPVGQPTTATQRGLDIALPKIPNLGAYESEEHPEMALARTETAMPVLDWPQQPPGPPPAPTDSPPAAPREHGVAYADTILMDYAEGAPTASSAPLEEGIPAEILDERSTPKQDFTTTQDWGAPHFYEEQGKSPSSDDAPPSPTDEVPPTKITTPEPERFQEPSSSSNHEDFEKTTPIPPPAPFSEVPPTAPYEDPPEKKASSPSKDFVETMPVRPPREYLDKRPPPPSEDFEGTGVLAPPPTPEGREGLAQQAPAELAPELEELDFYLNHDLLDEAQELFEELRQRFGEDPHLIRRADQIPRA